MRVFLSTHRIGNIVCCKHVFCNLNVLLLEQVYQLEIIPAIKNSFFYIVKSDEENCNYKIVHFSRNLRLWLENQSCCFVRLLLIMHCVSIQKKSNSFHKELFQLLMQKLQSQDFVFALARENISAVTKELVPSLDPKIIIARFIICAGFENR